eukprot:237421-Rhodomonas_salina.2
MSTTAAPVTITLVESAIKLAQLHLAELPIEVPTARAFKAKTAQEDEDEMDTDPVALAAHITKKQKVLSVLQQGGSTPTQGGRGGYTCQ